MLTIVVSKRQKIGFQDRLALNAGQKYCRMLQGEHPTIYSTFIKLPFAIKIFFCLFLSGCFTQVLLYTLIISLTKIFTSPDIHSHIIFTKLIKPAFIYCKQTTCYHWSSEIKHISHSFCAYSVILHASFVVC